MQPDDQDNQTEHLRSRMRKYDAYDPNRSYVRPANEASQATSYVPPHDVRSGYVPPQLATYTPPESQPAAPAAYVAPQYSEPAQYAQQQPAYEPYQAYQDPAQPAPYNPITEPRISNSAAAESFTSKQQAKSQRKQSGVFASIVKASVQVDRVTRQSVKAVTHTFEPPHISVLRTKRQRFALRSFYTAAALSMFATLFLGVHQFVLKDVKSPTTQGVLGAQSTAQNDATRGSEAPSEIVPSTQDMKTFLVAPTYPRYLRIPSMNIQARIRRLGIDSSGAVGTPNNVHDAGWYDSSVKPGDKDGTSLIIGHLSGPSAHGVFWDINKLAVGAKIEIEKGNGEIVTYKVTHVDSIPSDSFNIVEYLKSETPGHNDLRLVTSTGKYDNVSVQGADRYVVFATQVL
jgi:LPXTG-site transpeptidase (sortase) family protein